MTGLDEKGMVIVQKEVVYLSPKTAGSPDLFTVWFNGAAIMKKLCVIFILAPMVLFPFVLLWPDGVGGWLSWPWILCTGACIVCGFSIYHRQRWLGRACLVVGFLHLALVILLPILMPPKTRMGVSVEPLPAGNEGLRCAFAPRPLVRRA